MIVAVIFPLFEIIGASKLFQQIKVPCKNHCASNLSNFLFVNQNLFTSLKIINFSSFCYFQNSILLLFMAWKNERFADDSERESFL